MGKQSRLKHRCALIFIRAPELGKVKTRLAKTLKPETVLQLYKKFVCDVIETIDRCTDHFRICYYPGESEELIKEWIGNSYHYMPQEGMHLGERMKNAFLQVFQDGYSHVILVGSDIPGLPARIVQEAFAALDHQKPVIGPAIDGGYYLIGFNRDVFFPQVFGDIPWGTEAVFKKTMAVFEKEQQPVYRLPTWRDIDEYKDLLDFIRRIAPQENTARHTVKYLATLGLI